MQSSLKKALSLHRRPNRQARRLVQLIPLYAHVSKLRLFASDNVIVKAEEVMWRIIQTYERPEKTSHSWRKEASVSSTCFGFLARPAAGTWTGGRGLNAQLDAFERADEPIQTQWHRPRPTAQLYNALGGGW